MTKSHPYLTPEFTGRIDEYHTFTETLRFGADTVPAPLDPRLLSDEFFIPRFSTDSAQAARNRSAIERTMHEPWLAASTLIGYGVALAGASSIDSVGDAVGHEPYHDTDKWRHATARRLIQLGLAASVMTPSSMQDRRYTEFTDPARAGHLANTYALEAEVVLNPQVRGADGAWTSGGQLEFVQVPLSSRVESRHLSVAVGYSAQEGVAEVTLAALDVLPTRTQLLSQPSGRLENHAWPTLDNVGWAI